MRSIMSRQLPRTEISRRWLSHMSSSTSTMPRRKPAAQMVVALQQNGPGAVARRRQAADVRRVRRPPPLRRLRATRASRAGRSSNRRSLRYVYPPGCVPKSVPITGPSRAIDACAWLRRDPRRPGMPAFRDRVQLVWGCRAVPLHAAQCDCSGFHLMSQRSTRVMIRKLPDKAAHRTIAAYTGRSRHTARPNRRRRWPG